MACAFEDPRQSAIREATVSILSFIEAALNSATSRWTAQPNAVWGSDVYVEARTVDVHVGRLRKALSVEGVQDPVRTVRSAGYTLEDGVITA